MIAIEDLRQLCLCSAVSQPLIGHEEERAVLKDRSTQRASKDILVKDGPSCREVVAVVQKCVAIEFKAVSVELIRTAFQRFVNDGSRVAAEFRIERAGDDIDFR